MKKKSAFSALLLACLMTFSVFGAACNAKPSGNGDGDGPGGGPSIDGGTDLTTDTAISLVAGQKCTLTASSGVTWASSDTNVATVNGSGEVTAKTKGVAKITASKQGEVNTCTVIVLAASEASSSGTVKNPFSFNQSIQIGSVTSSGSGPVVSDPNADEYVVTFSDGAIAQNVAKGGLAVEPLVEKDGQYLKGWYKDSAKSEPYDFKAPVTETLNLTADWGQNPSGFELVQGNNESIALEWTGSVQTVQYTVSGTSNWKTVDAPLVRENGGTVRADILGLKAGKYDVKVGSTEITEIPVKAYDRSGYAHFNNTDGVGAYNNDGTLKDDALVIYVTDENKNNVIDSVYQNGEKFDIPAQYLTTTTDSLGVTSGKQTGIGEILNNRRYSGNDRLGVGIAKLCDIYGAVAVRFIGTVKNTTNYKAGTKDEGSATYGKTEINGLTWYAKGGDYTPYDFTLQYKKGVAVPNGGTVNDNGSMARITNAHDVTIEGVGDDTVIQGWGFHFVSSVQSGKSSRAGSSFEVRNITFNEYPEDAIGFEGEAESKKITSPVQRCWVHNNTFLPGYCPSPAESDKAEGDGSCDFKRGYYFTASYNYFEYCHKTNLVGSSDDSLQFNMTYHHNIWYQCGSRIPLTRQANVHFYNNYVFGDPAEKTTPYAHISKPALSYVHSLRASCYLFSEYNYYEGCKNLLRGASEGGDGKFFGNTYYACSDTKAPVSEVGSRTQTVSNNCNDPTPGTGHSYSTFDTDPSLFYYDATNKKTAPQSGILDDSLSARLRAIFYAGAQGHSEITKKMQEMNNSAPENNPSVTKAFKAKGQAYVFKVTAAAVLTIDASGETPQVLRNDGKIYLEAFSGQRTVMLDPGIYMVCSGKKDKEITINSLSVQVDNEEAKAARIAEAERLISAIPDTITRSSGPVIEQAAAAYASLVSDEERNALSDGIAERLAKAQAAYEEISVAYVMARIDYIGTVTLDSKNDIEEAAKAYSALSAAAKALVTNYNKLTEANATFAGFAIDSVAFELNRLPLSTGLTVLLDSKPAVELALELYNDALEAYTELDLKELSDADLAKLDVTNVNAAIAILNEALNLVEFRELLAGFDDNPTITKDDKAQVVELKAAYSALTADQINGLTTAEKAKYQAIDDGYNALFAGRQSGSFAGGVSSNEVFQITGSAHSNRDEKNWPIPDGEGAVLNAGMKMEQNTEITFVTSSTKTLTLYFSGRSAGNKVKVDGTSYTISTQTIGGYTYSVLVIENLAAGTHKITKDSSNVDIMYAVLDD